MWRNSFIIIVGFSILTSACGQSERDADIAVSFSEGVAAYSNGDYGTALTLIEPHAKAGDTAAQIMMAELYITGKAGVIDETRGVSWLEKAAESGHIKAQSMMGTRYLSGDGVEVDETRGIKYLQSAAKKGNVRANVQLGFLYEYGKFVDQNLDAAGRFYYRAAVIGDEEGVARLKKLADANFVGPRTYLGLLYRDGKGVESDASKAFALVESDAQAGQPYAQYLISEAYGVGQGTDRSLENAYMWANLSAGQSFPEAAKRRDVWAQLMTPDQIAAAQTLSRDWQAKFDAANP
ncbi:tetratricopeptide repeat protein [Robiginitomaculum antarcticum]|uniref:tetratricopeptide repeat protein n=1 Tax=Robiginitomaculum antarcticum TaxID=437507 RepID=UPI00037A2590|nr:tetratricopeptide repeat protein [Robiginitomaculum antarcticum]